MPSSSSVWYWASMANRHNQKTGHTVTLKRKIGTDPYTRKPVYETWSVAALGPEGRRGSMRGPEGKGERSMHFAQGTMYAVGSVA